MPERNAATHKTVADGDGYRFLFYCDVSGAHVCTTKEIYHADSPEAALLTAWEAEGRGRFNKCHKCGKWVIDAVYNIDVLECVDCAPYEFEPKYCKNCGARINASARHCPACGRKLIYEGGVANDDAESMV